MEWWTYSPRDLLLFSARTYYRLFELYNHEWWPLQLFALALGDRVFRPTTAAGSPAGAPASEK